MIVRIISCWLVLAVSTVPSLLNAQVVLADPQPLAENRTTSYVRISATAEGDPQSLDTAIARFVGRSGTKYAGVTIDLVGAVHIGDAEYYQAIQKRFAGYEVVLYELVAPDGTRIHPEDLEKRRGLLASMQTGMKDTLNLSYQLEEIDYTAKNFRHADMSPDEFFEDMEKRGDSLFKMFARMMGAGLANASTQSTNMDMLLALFSKDRSMRMKQIMATQLIQLEIGTAGMNDANGENTIIKGRNRKAFDILAQELALGKRKIAVFYGAAHLSDMADRLKRDFNMEPKEIEWLPAWDLQRN